LKLWDAAKYNDIMEINRLLNLEIPPLIDAEALYEQTALHNAVNHNSYQAVSELLRYGANINCRTS